MQQKHIVVVRLEETLNYSEVNAENVNSIDIKIGDKVVLYFANRYDIGTVVSEEKIVEENKIDKKNLYKLVRKINEQDLQRLKENENKAQEAYKIIKQTCLNYELPIKIVATKYSFDRTRLYVYYIKYEHANLNKVIHEFAHKFKTRVEMKQVGARDETKILGGIGVCGQELCCKKWIKKFESIAVEMAKVQQLTLNIPKLSGICNRLKCCLAYEYEFYKDCVSKFPKIGSKIKTDDGEGKIISIDCIKQLVNVELKKDENTSVIKTFKLQELQK
jgi:cell fate regulator YaaT (PSP1 superfamily)